MKVSVCIPCDSKHIHLLQRCIDSVRIQTQKAHELIVSVSNHTGPPPILCTDNIETVVMVTDKRLYAGDNRNICLDHATGDVITFVDADDMMYPNRIQVLDNVFSKYRSCHVLFHYFIENQMVDTYNAFNSFYLAKYAYDERLHFGHISLRRCMIGIVRYTSKPRGQDVEYVENLLNHGYRRYMYMYKQPLTIYNSNDSTYYANV